MAQAFQHTSTPLPGPVTAPGARTSQSSPPIPMVPIRSSTNTSSQSVDEETKLSMAWKYEGYQAFSKWMASDDDFFVFRRFESLNANTMLWMQDHISRLETELAVIHKTVEDSKLAEGMTNDSFRSDERSKHDVMRRRDQIMVELSRQLLHYNQFIDAFSKVRTRPRAEQRQVDNVENWLHRRNAIVAHEAAFVIDHSSDLISINSRSSAPLGQWLEACRKLHHWKLFRAKEVQGLHVKSSATVYSSNQKFDGLTTYSIIIMGLIMLLAPMWWLECVSPGETRLKIITGFVCLFIVIMSTATVHRPFEVVASTAAYAAVLMVFMQIDGNGSPTTVSAPNASTS